MYITIHVRVDDQVDALRIAADHLSNGHWVAIEGLCDLPSTDTVDAMRTLVRDTDLAHWPYEDRDTILAKRAAAPTTSKPFIDQAVRIPDEIRSNFDAIDNVACPKCGVAIGEYCQPPSGDNYGKSFVHTARRLRFLDWQAGD